MMTKNSWQMKLNKNKAVFTFPRVLCSRHRMQAKWPREPRCPVQSHRGKLLGGPQTRLERDKDRPRTEGQSSRSLGTSLPGQPWMNGEAGVSSQGHLPPTHPLVPRGQLRPPWRGSCLSGFSPSPSAGFPGAQPNKALTAHEFLAWRLLLRAQQKPLLCKDLCTTTDTKYLPVYTHLLHWV